MFGHDDHDDDTKDESVVVDAATDQSASTDASATVTPVVSDEGDNVEDIIETPQPAEESTPAPEPAAEVTPEESTPSVTASPTASDDAPTTGTADPALLELKKQALEELSPLVEHLDQTPEEKFKTIMMLIQATDSSNLISTAHEAAKAITDEKVRAQALLDIVNEINYFTQK